MSYVITCGDEGVQINEGIRLGVLGAGIKLEGVEEIFKILKKIFKDKLRVASSSENAWTKEQFDLATWEQTNATMQQYAEMVADKNGLLYSGFLPFADPQDLDHDIKGHMVRPRGIHIATQIQFTLAGGEQTYHLGQNLISAEWVADADFETAKKLIDTQVEFYNKIAGRELPVVFETEGELGEEFAKKNQAVLEKMGYKVN
jgi:hypothetical protein